MGMLSDYAQNKITDAIHRGQALGAPATMYFALLKCTKGARVNSTAYALNDTIAVTANDGKIHLYKCTTAGTTAASQSTLYPGTKDEAITDGTAVMTEQGSALDAGTAVSEPSGGSYARASVVASLANWSGTQSAGSTTASSGTAGASSNNGAITYAAPTADWCSGLERIWGWAMYDASSAGNLWEWAPLTTIQAVTNGQAAPSFAAAALQVTYGN